MDYTLKSLQTIVLLSLFNHHQLSKFLKKICFPKAFCYAVVIAPIEVGTKSKIFNVKFRSSVKCEIVSQSETCVLV